MSSISLSPATFHQPRMAQAVRNESALSRVGFALFILLNLTLFVRPAELFEGLEGWPFYEWLIEACFLVSLPAIFRELMPENLKRWPINYCMVALLPAVVVSHLCRLQIREALSSSVEMSKLLLYFVLLVVNINSLGRFKIFLLTIGFSTILMAGLALLQYHHIVEVPTLSAYYERQNQIDEDSGEAVTLGRLCGLGIFNNPNDFSRILVIAIFICLYFMGERKQGPVRFLWVAPLLMLGYGNALTYSRGGLLGLLGGLGALFYMRYGMARTMVIGGLVLPALLIVFGGRQTNVNLSEGDTGHQRIMVWQDGFADLRGSPIFGTGMNSYMAMHGIVAHNSFVHAYTELGFVGGSLFFGMFYFGAYDLLKSRARDSRLRDANLLRARPFVLGILISYGIGLLSSTRCYEVPTYAVTGIAASYMRLLAHVPGIVDPINGKTIKRMGTASFLLLMGLYIFVRLKA